MLFFPNQCHQAIKVTFPGMTDVWKSKVKLQDEERVLVSPDHRWSLDGSEARAYGHLRALPHPGPDTESQPMPVLQRPPDQDTQRPPVLAASGLSSGTGPRRPSEAASMPSALDTQANVVLLVSTWSPLEGAPPEDREMSPQPLGLCACVCVCVCHSSTVGPSLHIATLENLPLAQPCQYVLPSCCCLFVFFDLIYNNHNYGVFGANLFAPCVPIPDLTLDSWR